MDTPPRYRRTTPAMGDPPAPRDALDTIDRELAGRDLARVGDLIEGSADNRRWLAFVRHVSAAGPKGGQNLEAVPIAELVNHAVLMTGERHARYFKAEECDLVYRHQPGETVLLARPVFETSR